MLRLLVTQELAQTQVLTQVTLLWDINPTPVPQVSEAQELAQTGQTQVLTQAPVQDTRLSLVLELAWVILVILLRELPWGIPPRLLELELVSIQRAHQD